MKEAVTKVIDTLTQEDFHEAFQRLFEQYNKCTVAGGDYLFNDPHICMYNNNNTMEFSVRLLGFIVFTKQQSSGS